MQILMLIQSPHIQGPLAKHTPLLIRSLQNLGCEVRTSDWGRHSDYESLLEKILGRATDIISIWKELRRRKFDIMVVKTSHDWATLCRDIPLTLATRRLSEKIVIQMHGSQSNRMVAPGSFLFKVATKFLLHFADAILVLSTEEQRQWREFYPRGIFYVVDNPFLPMDEETLTAPETFSDIPPNFPILLFVGRLIVEKGIYELLDAMALVLKQKECFLLIAGVGPEKVGLEKKIRNLRLTKNVALLGYIQGERLASLYRCASIFTLPSYHYEGFPTVVTEAMSFGLPLITTPIRGVVDHLHEGVNALFIPPRNSLALVDAILKLFEDRDLQTRMKAANLEKVKQFVPERVGKKYYQTLMEIVNERKNDN